MQPLEMVDRSRIIPLGFYRTGYSVTPPVDGDEVGGIPVWYANTTGSPQWDPAASATYRPFIFGYIEDPGSATKKQVYHEMKIQVYNGTSAYRQMLYRFYMTLSADQMLYSRMFGAPPCAPYPWLLIAMEQPSKGQSGSNSGLIDPTLSVYVAHVGNDACPTVGNSMHSLSGKG